MMHGPINLKLKFYDVCVKGNGVRSLCQVNIWTVVQVFRKLYIVCRSDGGLAVG